MSVAWRPVADGIVVAVRVDPRSRRDAVLGVVEDADGAWLRIGVTAAPEDGRATRAACETLASALELARGAVSLLSGAVSRRKRLHASGEAAALIEAIERIAGT